jgi:hypothetical protein
MEIRREVLYHVVLASISFIFLFAGYLYAIERKTPDSSEILDEKRIHAPTLTLQKKADLIVEKVEINRDYPNDVDVVITIKNKGGSTSHSLSDKGSSHGSQGECIAIVKWRSSQSEKYIKQLCKATVPKLSTNQTYKFSCHDIVPQLHMHEYRAEVDTLNWIDESNEKNNTNTAHVVNY